MSSQSPVLFNQGFDESGINLIHHMPDDGSGVYIKETFIPKGMALDMHTHTFTHKSVLAAGSVLLTAGGVQMIVNAPAVMTILTGVPHRVQAMTDATWLCIHATDETDPERIDHTLIGG